MEVSFLKSQVLWPYLTTPIQGRVKMGSLINVAASLRLVSQKFMIRKKAGMPKQSISRQEAIPVQVHRHCCRCICTITQIKQSMRNQEYRDPMM
ncbi:hypothetical protein CSX02_12130 [Agathobacter ruminis]|uniref:Uncharacterized protein n=1 Tax=Agathobacter ruminis TaxID=1712665 RepID=A0A2G3DZ64_9FIRM|nr:hypothetical protein CSX02_12130 [Agathobacter ruminis]